MSEPPIRHSIRTPLVPSPHMRKPAVRLSTDQTALVGANVPLRKRL